MFQFRTCNFNLEGQPASTLRSTITRKLVGALPLLIALFICGHLVFLPETADAQSASCNRLSSRLAALGSPRKPSSARSSKFSKAVKKQQQQIRKIDRVLGNLGCRRKRKLFSRSISPRCSPLRKQKRRMVSNLSKLRSKANRIGRSGSRPNTAKKRRRILRKMVRAGCGKTRLAKKTSRSNDKRSLMEQIFGESKNRSRDRNREKDETIRQRKERLNERKKKKHAISTEEVLRNHNTFTTMCVRSCDGYYFPVSFSTTTDSFSKDAGSCSNLCPGTNMKLFYHRTTGQTVDDMVSAKTGNPYRKSKNAYSFRKVFNAACSCNYKLLNRGTIKKQTTKTAKASFQNDRIQMGRVAAPVYRIDHGQDPETRMNVSGNLSIDNFDDITSSKQKQNALPKRTVRVIGEEFFPSQ